MKYELSDQSLASTSADAVIGFVFETSGGDSGSFEPWDRLTGGLVAELFARGEFKGKQHSSARVHRPSGMAAKQLVLIGCGPKEKFSSAVLRECAGVAGRLLRTAGSRNIAIQPPDPSGVQAIVEGFSAALYEPDC